MKSAPEEIMTASILPKVCGSNFHPMKRLFAGLLASVLMIASVEYRLSQGQ